MVCKKCGARLADDAVFCTECGEKINSPLCCPECGNELEEGSKFCVYCGADLTLPKAVKTTAENKYIPNYNTSGYEQPKKKNKFPVAAIVILAIVSILVISFAVRAVRRKKYEEELERLAEEYRQESNNSYSEPETYLEYSENSPVEILNAWTAEYMDRPIFVVSYRWTNTENTNQSALYNVSVSAYQNGIELEKPIFYDEDDDLRSRDIKPGVSVVIEEAFYLDDTVSDIEVEATPWFDLNGEVYVAETFWFTDADSYDDMDYYSDYSEYVLPFSDTVYLEESDLYGLSQNELKIARNEIYARHGRMFKDEQLQAYFDACSWYIPSIAPEDFKDSMLNSVEIANRDLIVEYEKSMGYR
mgnify:CR=1 FL=1